MSARARSFLAGLLAIAVGLGAGAALSGWIGDREASASIEDALHARPTATPAPDEAGVVSVALSAEEGLRERLSSAPTAAAGPADQVVLHCLDAVTREPLRELRAVLDDRSLARTAQPRLHPGLPPRGLELRPGASSPLQLSSPVSGPAVYWLSSPRHAWVPVVLGVGARGERTLLVPRAGDLLVQITGAVREHHTALRLHQIEADGPQSAVFAEIDPLRGDANVLESLPPARYLCRLEVGSRPGALVVDEVVAEVTEGGTELVTLRYDAPEAGPTGGIAGTLSLAEVDPDLIDAVHLVVEPVGDSSRFQRHDFGLWNLNLSRMTPLPGDRAWSFGMEGLPAGSYTLTVDPFGSQVAVTVLPAETVNVAIEVPPLARALVSFLGPSGEIVGELSSVSARFSGREVRMRFEDGMQGYDLTCVPGTVEIDWFDATYGIRSHELELAPGWSSHEIVLAPAQVVQVRLEREGAPLAVSPQWWFGVRWEGRGEGRTLLNVRVPGGADGRQNGLSAAEFEVSGPGEYVVRFPEIEGGPKLPDRSVTVERDAPTVLVLDVPH